MRRFLFEVILMIAVLFVVPSSRADQHLEFTDDYPSEVATVWFDTLYQTVRSESIAFPEAARIYGVSAVALYEAVVPGALHHRSLAGQLNSLAAVPQPEGLEQLPLAHGGKRRARPHDPWPIPVAKAREPEGYQRPGAALRGSVPS